MAATTPTVSARSSRRIRSTFSLPGQRLREMERIIKDRHGQPATDDADLYLIPIAECFVKIAIDRGRAAATRKANGATPRAAYEANSLSKTKPWENNGNQPADL